MGSSIAVSGFQPVEHTHDGRIYPFQMMRLDTTAPLLRFFRPFGAATPLQTTVRALSELSWRDGPVSASLLVGALVFEHAPGDLRPYPSTAAEPQPFRPAVMVWTSESVHATRLWWGEAGEDPEDLYRRVIAEIAPNGR